MAKKEKVSIDAEQVVKQAIVEARGYYQEYKQYPTLRGIYYRLVSRDIIPNIRSAYQRLSVILSQARKRGEFPWEYMVDNSGRYISEVDSGYELDELKSRPESAINDKLSQIMKYLRNANSDQINLPLKRWSNQPYYVLATVEKDAMASAVRSILDPLGVPLVVMKGYSSVTQIHDLAIRLNTVPKDKKIVILQLTDYDPSGEDIARNLKDQLITDFNIVAQVEKIAVTQPQIEEYNLPHEPENEEEKEKLQRDPRFKNWAQGFYRVELDALGAIRPRDFRRILQSKVNEYFDTTIYNNAQKEKERIKERIQKMIKEDEMIQNMRNEIKDMISKIEERIGANN